MPLASNPAVGWKPLPKSKLRWSVSCYNPTRISRASHKSLLCKVGTANLRNTCVDMRCACVACRPLGGTRLLCSYPLALPESLCLFSPRLHAFLFRACMHPRSRRQLYSLLLRLRRVAALYNATELSAEHAEVGLLQISARTDSPCAYLRHSEK